MPRKKQKTSPWLIGVTAAAAAGTALLYYLKAGAGSGKNAVFIPDALEDKLDYVVDTLNQKFEKTWIDQGLSLLERTLATILPTSLVALVDVVYRTEQWAKGQEAATGRKVASHEKRVYAAKLCPT